MISNINQVTILLYRSCDLVFCRPGNKDMVQVQLGTTSRYKWHRISLSKSYLTLGEAGGKIRRNHSGAPSRTLLNPLSVLGYCAHGGWGKRGPPCGVDLAATVAPLTAVLYHHQTLLPLHTQNALLRRTLFTTDQVCRPLLLFHKDRHLGCHPPKAASPLPWLWTQQGVSWRVCHPLCLCWACCPLLRRSTKVPLCFFFVRELSTPTQRSLGALLHFF